MNQSKTFKGGVHVILSNSKETFQAKPTTELYDNNNNTTTNNKLTF